MDLAALVEFAQSRGYRPFFDLQDGSLDKLLEQITEAGLKPVVLTPGNDLYSHALEISRDDLVFQVLIRFDLRIFALTAFQKSGTARYSVAYDTKYNRVLRPMLDVLARRLSGNRSRRSTLQSR